MADVNILIDDVAIGNIALAKIGTFLDGSLDDMATVQVIWKNQNGTTLSDETWSGSDINTTGTNGETVSITDPTGTGNYEAKLQIVTASWPGVTASGVTGTVRVIITNQAVDGSGTADETFTFTVVPTNVTVSLSTTTVTNQVKRATGILDDVIHVAKSTTDTKINFGSGIIYDIKEAKDPAGGDMVNGVDYSWSTYKTFATLLANPGAAGDHYFFRIQRRLSDTEVDEYIQEATRYVKSKLSPYYSVGDINQNHAYLNLVASRAIGRIKEDLSEGVALESAHYRSGHDLKRDVDAIIRDIQAGKASLVDEDGTLAERTPFSLMGGFTHSDGVASTRLDLLDRAQQSTGVYVTLFPEVVKASPRSL